MSSSPLHAASGPGFEEEAASIFAETVAFTLPHLHPLENAGAAGAGRIFAALMASPVVELPDSFPPDLGPYGRIFELQLTLHRVAATAAAADGVPDTVRVHMRDEAGELVAELDTADVVRNKVDGSIIMCRTFLMRVWSMTAVDRALQRGSRTELALLLRRFPCPLSSTGSTVPPAVLAHRLTTRGATIGSGRGAGAIPAAATSSASGHSTERLTGSRRGAMSSRRDDAIGSGQDAGPYAVCPSCARTLVDSLGRRDVLDALPPGLLAAGITDSGVDMSAAGANVVRLFLVSLRAARRAFAMFGVEWPRPGWPGCARCRAGGVGR